jgi:hypothetical protein
LGRLVAKTLFTAFAPWLALPKAAGGEMPEDTFNSG